MNPILEARETRGSMIEKLVNQHHFPVLMAKLNVVGPIKKHTQFYWILRHLIDYIERHYTQDIVDKHVKDSADGPYVLFVMKHDPIALKKDMIHLEESLPAGRLLDLDVTFDQAISRQDLLYPKRSCLICGLEADGCARAKRHDLQTVMTKMDQIADTALNDFLCKQTLKAMRAELALYPCFGLVSYHDSGAHQDMDYHTFEHSIDALEPTIKNYLSSPLDAKNLNAIGKEGEDAMFLATKNINTHKGLIFLLGVFLSAIKKSIQNNLSLEVLQEDIAAISKDIVGNYYDTLTDVKTHGDRIYLDYKIKGIRQIALDGLGIVFADQTNNPYDQLCYFMSIVNDTTIIHRFTLHTLKAVQKDMSEFLMLGGYKDHKTLYTALSDNYKKRGISPGGSADLWVLSTLFKATKHLLK